MNINESKQYSNNEYNNVKWLNVTGFHWSLNYILNATAKIFIPR